MATVSMTSIPPDFFDEERDKVFQMEIIQDSLVERIDKLIKKSSEVDARLDIIEEEMEEQTKISINGKTSPKKDRSQTRPVSSIPVRSTPIQSKIRPKVNSNISLTSFLGVTPEKAKIIALEENKKLKNELEAAMKELKISLEESTAETQREFAAQKEKEASEKASTPSPAAPAPTLLVNAMNSSANFELDEVLKSKIEQLAKELKDNQLTNIENEEQIQMMNKRISAMEGGNAGVLGLIERINEVNIPIGRYHR